MAGRRHGVRGGWRYVVTDEQILAWQAVPAVERLRWLEEAMRMSYLALGPRGRRLRDLLRSGEV